MITVLTIKSNKFVFDRNKYYNNLSQLKHDIQEYVNIIEIDPSDLMETIITEIGLTPELIGSSPVCEETATNVYQLCYAGEKDQVLDKTKNIINPNYIANYLTNDSVENNCVFLNSKIGDTKICEHDSVDMDILVKILYSKFIHVGVVIKTDMACPVTEFIYGGHPIEYYKTTDYDENKYKIIEFDFISFAMCAVIDLQPENNVINKRFTRIYGQEIIYGDVLLITKLPDAYQDLPLDLYEKINTLSFGPIINRSLSEDEKKDPEKINELQIVSNKYCVINERINSMKKNYEHECSYNNCTKITSKLHTCISCYRVKYHDKECQIADWDNHKLECFYDKEQ